MLRYNFFPIAFKLNLNFDTPFANTVALKVNKLKIRQV